MEQMIFNEYLSQTRAERLRFSYNGNALPVGPRVRLEVRDRSGGLWIFVCKNEGDNMFSISGSGWRDFAAGRIGYIVTLSKEGGEYKITARN